MRLLQTIFTILRGIGYLGNGILFLYVEWKFLRQSFVQIFNPLLHLQVLGVVLTSPLFWIFLVLALVGYYAAKSVDKYLEKDARRSKAQYKNSHAQINSTAQPLSQKPNNFETKPDNLETSLEQRPYIRCQTDELERIAVSEWNNITVLTNVHHELKFRSRKKALDLRERIGMRLSQLQKTQYAWSTMTNSETQDLSTDAFKYEEGVLRHYGYKVGMHGLPENERWEILDSIFLNPLSNNVGDASYLSEWGEPGSSRRLQKLAESIAAFARNTKRRRKGDFSKAIRDWETDLAYLERTHYRNRFSFQYPRT